MKIIANMRVSAAISLLVAAAFIAISILASQIIIRDLDNVKHMSQLSDMTKLAGAMSDLMHEQQKERAYTGVYVGSNGKSFKSEMESQRQVTDKRKNDFQVILGGLNKAALGEVFNEKINSILSDIAKMDEVRSSISNLSIDRDNAIGYYTKSNAKIIDLVSYMPNLSDDPDIALNIVSYANFMKGKEYSGIERANGAVGFSAGVFSPEAINKLREVIAAQDAYSAVFLSYASDAQKAIYEKINNDSATKEVERMRQIALNNNPEEVKTVLGTYWTDTITKKINGLREIEESFASDLSKKMDSSLKDAKSTETANIIMVAATIIIILLFSFIIARTIVSSLSRVATATEELADGKLDTALPPLTNNEVGKIISALVIFKDNALQMEKIKHNQQEQEQLAAEEKRKAMNQMADSFEMSVKGAVSQVASSATQMQSGAENVTHIAEDTKKRSHIVVNASTEAAQTSAQVAAAAEELTASIKEISSQTQKSSQIASEAASKAEYAKNAINLLSEKAMNVAQIIEVITGIAGQINLLALNATIESARAGEAGKGFAVVASEVKNLANQVGKATGEITQQINEMQGATKNSVDSVMDILSIISQVSTSTAAVATAVEEQSAVTREIAHNIGRTSSGTQEISQNMASVQDGAEKTGITAAQVLESAKNLNTQSNTLKQKVDEFLKTIRTA